MSWPTLRFQNQLPAAVRRELEALVTQVTAYLAVGHAPDGLNQPPAALAAGLPTGVGIGVQAVITDALGPVIGSAVVGGGAATAMVWWTGTDWRVFAL